MPRFFVKDENIEENRIYIKDDDAYHIARSLRMREGDTVTVSDGRKYEYECRLLKIRDEECECEILERKEGKSEPVVFITLYMGYPKGDKLEGIVQKATELGVSRIIPFESSRCIKRPKEERRQKQLLRLNKIGEEAAKQSGRLLIPEVCDTVSFAEVVSQVRNTLSLFCYEGGGESLKSVLETAGGVENISVIVGPEGGFSPEEAEALRLSGCRVVTLGERILRCETAPLYVLSALSYHFEL